MKLYNLLYSIWITIALSVNVVAIFTYPTSLLSYLNMAIVLLACVIYPPFQSFED